MLTMGPYDITRVDTTQQHPLGTLFGLPSAVGPDGTSTANAPMAIYEYVKNGEASTAWAEGTGVRHKAGSTIREMTVNATSISPVLVAGFSQRTVAAGSFAWILRSGVGSVIAGASVTSGAALEPDAATAGRVTDVGASTDGGCGHFISNGTTAGSVATAYVNCQG